MDLLPTVQELDEVLPHSFPDALIFPHARWRTAPHTVPQGLQCLDKTWLGNTQFKNIKNQSSAFGQRIKVCFQ